MCACCLLGGTAVDKMTTLVAASGSRPSGCPWVPVCVQCDRNPLWCVCLCSSSQTLPVCSPHSGLVRACCGAALGFKTVIKLGFYGFTDLRGNLADRGAAGR